MLSTRASTASTASTARWVMCHATGAVLMQLLQEATLPHGGRARMS